MTEICGTTSYCIEQEMPIMKSSSLSTGKTPVCHGVTGATYWSLVRDKTLHKKLKIKSLTGLVYNAESFLLELIRS